MATNPAGAMSDTSLRCGACRETSLPFAFSMAFQPVIDIAAMRIDAHEALVRGCDGAGAYTVLQRVTEQNRYGFDQSCRVRAIELAASLGLRTRLNINFMPNAVYDPRACIRLTLDAASRTGLPPTALTFEIVEGEEIARTEHLVAIMREYRRQGFQVALDDFGTGYSGLARLAELQPDIVKLDRVLIDGCDGNPTKRAILDAIAKLCRRLGIKLVAEGVETATELDAVREAGIQFVQGFYFARPSFERLLTEADLPMLGGTREPDLATKLGLVP